MAFSILAKHAQGKVAKDKIFIASTAANQAIEKYGKEQIINATIGAIYDESGQLCFLPTVEKCYRDLPSPELIQYAGISGLPDFIDAVIDEACGKSRPNAHMAAIATAGGTGVIHHVVWNYASEGDKIITSDWYWGVYASICKDMLRSLETYEMFDKNNKYNIDALESKMRELAKTQDNVVAIINTPAHNPTGYTVSNEEWDAILDRSKKIIEDTGKNIVILVDLAYLDYAGEREEVRSFIKKFENLPEKLLIVLGYSMSKGFTLYGQRTGAMIGISSNPNLIQEFKDANQFTSRATWSNINRPCMRTLVNICKDPQAFAAVQKERTHYYNMIKERADIFSQEAKEANLKMLPYIAGFFISMESKDPDAICDKLHEDFVYAVPLAKGVRIAVCSVPKEQLYGLAAKVKKVFVAIEK